MAIRLLVCDLDNTLYDWVGFFVPSLYAMVDAAAAILQCDNESLLDSLKLVHQKYHDSEHPFALLETDIVARRLAHFDVEERRRILDPAFKAFNAKRKGTLRLYPRVQSTLNILAEAGVKLVAHTESQTYAVVFRLRSLNLTPYFDRIYCRERPYTTLVDSARAAMFWTDFPMNKVVELSHHQRKPNPDVLGEICRDYSVCPSDAGYLGDSIARDVFMAAQAGTRAIWAEYGSQHDPALWARLVRISHWTSEDVDREKLLKGLASNVVPDFVARDSIEEIIPFVLN